MHLSSSLTALLFCSSLAFAQVDNRDVQFRSINFDDQIIEIYNFSNVAIDLSGWRFCSHDFDQARQYSSPSGLDGVSIAANGSVWIHFLDDAPAGDPARLNRSDVGAFALPLDQDAYGTQLFFPDANGFVSFGNSTLIADHLQWNVDGQSGGLATTRSGQAVSEGLWTDENDFISTHNGRSLIELNDLNNGRLHGPSDYDVSGGLDLVMTPLVRGQQATVEASGAAVYETVYFLYSFNGTGVGPCPPALGDLCLDLQLPIVTLGTAIADPSGMASFSATVPYTAPLVPVSTQAVVARGVNGADSVKSNTVTETIQ